MSPQNDRFRSDAEEEKPRSTRRWVESPKKRTAEEEEKRDPDVKPRKGSRRQDSEDWDDDLVDDLDLEDFEDDLDLEDSDLDDLDPDPDLDADLDEEPLP